MLQTGLRLPFYGASADKIWSCARPSREWNVEEREE